METQLLIMVVDPDDPKRVEITTVDNTAQAARMVETMLEAGFEQSRIKIFEGIQLEMKVAHRPVVSLISQEEPATHAAAPPPPEHQASQSQAAAEPADAEPEPFVQNGVRFSSLFKPAS